MDSSFTFTYIVTLIHTHVFFVSSLYSSHSDWTLPWLNQLYVQFWEFRNPPYKVFISTKLQGGLTIKISFSLSQRNWMSFIFIGKSMYLRKKSYQRVFLKCSRNIKLKNWSKIIHLFFSFWKNTAFDLIRRLLIRFLSVFRFYVATVKWRTKVGSLSLLPTTWHLCIYKFW